MELREVARTAYHLLSVLLAFLTLPVLGNHWYTLMFVLAAGVPIVNWLTRAKKPAPVQEAVRLDPDAERSE